MRLEAWMLFEKGHLAKTSFTVFKSKPVNSFNSPYFKSITSSLRHTWFPTLNLNQKAMTMQ